MRAVAAIAVALAGCSFDGGGVGAGDGDAAAPDAPAGDDPDAAAIDAAAPDAAPPPIDGPPPDPPGTLHATDAPAVMVIDGEGSEFEGAPVLAWDIEDGERYVTTHASYTASARLELQAMHDPGYLYVYARVIDEAYQVDSVDLWNDDGIAIYLDVLGDALGPYGADDHELIVRGDGMWGDYGPVGTPASLTVAAVPTALGYSIEIQIDKTSLSATVGASMGFDALLTDDDGWGDSNYDAYSVWFVSSRPPCATCCVAEDAAMPWCDTTTFGTLVLD